MRLYLRAVVAFLALPGVVAFVLPLGIATLDHSPAPINLAAVPVLVIGLVLLLWCVRDFFVAGRGTLAPWSPPRRLVVVGLYRFSRNPMYLSVIAILCGWAIAFASLSLTLYIVVVAALFHYRVTLYEEPWLEREFGEEWRQYRSEVPRWIGRREDSPDKSA